MAKVNMYTTILIFLIAQVPVLVVCQINNDLTIGLTTTQSIEVRWLRINPFVDSYNLTCTSAGGTTVSTNQPCCAANCTGLTAGTEYHIVLIAYNWWGASINFTDPIFAKTDLAKSTNITVNVQTATTLQVSWQAAEGNKDSYTVTCTSMDGGTTTASALASSTSANCTELNPGLRYSIAVTTSKDGWVSVNSTEIITGSTSLAAVTNLKIMQTTTTSLKISWTTAAGSQDGYSVSCRYSASNYKIVPVNNGDVQTADCSGLTPGYAYTVTVITKKKDWTDVTSNDLTGRTDLDTVSSIMITTVTTSTISVSWQHATGGRSQYILTCSPTDREVSERHSTASSASGICSRLYGATNYNITVLTTKRGWNSVTTVGPMTKTIPMSPLYASLSSQSATSAEISWPILSEPYDDMVYNIKVYDVGRMGNKPQTLHTNISKSISGLNYVINGLEEFWYYYCSVQIIANGVTSQVRTTGRIQTNTAAPGPVRTLIIEKLPGKNASVSWFIPKETDWNGVILFYTLQIINSESLTIRSVPYHREETTEGQNVNYNFKYVKTIPKLPSGNLTFEIWATTVLVSDTVKLFRGSRVRASIMMEEGTLSSEQSAMIGMGIVIGILILLLFVFVGIGLFCARKNEFGFFKKTTDTNMEMEPANIYENGHILGDANDNSCPPQENPQQVYETYAPNDQGKATEEMYDKLTGVNGGTSPAATGYSYPGSSLPTAKTKVVAKSPQYADTKVKKNNKEMPDSIYVNQALVRARDPTYVNQKQKK